MSATVSYNCACSDTNNLRTLKSLRDEMMRRLGFSAQVDNPPPGMADLLNSFLQEAQELLYRRYETLRTERFFSWDLAAGTRLYDLPDNEEGQGVTPECTKKLDERSLSWVGIVRDGQWYELLQGIPPELYAQDQTGWPSRYEIRQCIEVWPVPDETNGSLVIKGRFGLDAFAEDDDKATIDDRLIFLLALANAKSHYGRQDAGNAMQEMEVYLHGLVAGSHQTRRYIPGTDMRADMIYVRPKPSVPFS